MNAIQLTPALSLVPVPAFRLVFGPDPDQFINLPADVAVTLANVILAFNRPLQPKPPPTE